MRDAIAHFKILDSLGSGGLGDVYKARDTRLGRTVAVKVLPPALTTDLARLDDLHDTALRLIELSHPNIAMIFEGGQDGDDRFLVFEFVQGQPLASLINGRALQIRQAVEFAINLSDALADAHAKGLVHGDIRPDTITITPKDRAKFMNFGLARFTAGGMARVSSATPYASPEELAGQPAGPLSDIYSLGAVVFEMLSGRQRTRGVVLGAINPNVPKALEQIVSRMVASNTEHRSQSAASVAAELRNVAAVLDTRTEAAEAAAASEVSRRRTPNTAKKKSSATMLALIVVVALLAALAMWMAGRVS
jgi:eukaryotic-like serine/threonine-protein kinase